MGKIPPQAKQVFKGEIFDVYQWRQKLYDGSRATFEALRRPHAAGVIAVTPDGQVLVVEDEQPHRSPVLTVPGGRMDPGETPLVAAQRELLEETGYTSDSWELWFSNTPAEKIDFTIHYYIARDICQMAKPDPGPGERITVRAVSVDELLDGIIEGRHCDTPLATAVLRQIAQGKRGELTEFLLGAKKTAETSLHT